MYMAKDIFCGPRNVMDKVYRDNKAVDMNTGQTYRDFIVKVVNL